MTITQNAQTIAQKLTELDNSMPDNYIRRGVGQASELLKNWILALAAAAPAVAECIRLEQINPLAQRQADVYSAIQRLHAAPTDPTALQTFQVAAAALQEFQAADLQRASTSNAIQQFNLQLKDLPVQAGIYSGYWPVVLQLLQNKGLV